MFALLAATCVSGRAQDLSGTWQRSRGVKSPTTGVESTINYTFQFVNQSSYRETALINGATILDVAGSYGLQAATRPNFPKVTALLTLQPGTPAVAPSQTNLALLVAASLPSTKSTQQWVAFSVLDSAPYMDLEGTTESNSWGLLRTSAGVIQTGWQFIPVAPCRVVDTRSENGALSGPDLAAGATRIFPIPTGSCNVPFTATAYSLNVTVVPDGKLEYLTVWPSGQTQPNVSTLNSDGRVKANAAIVPAGSDGAHSVSVFATDRTQVILDINGYFVPAGTSSALSFYPLTPCRVADTRNAASDLGGPYLKSGVQRSFPIQSSSCSIPATAEAYSLNFTVVPRAGLNYLTVWPSGGTQPVVSTLNASKGGATANAAIVPAGNGGALSIFATDDTDLVIDVNGYFASPASGGLLLYATAPCRVIDSRQGTQGPLAGSYWVNVKGSSCAPPSTAQGYVVNATVIPTASLAYLTIWPDGSNQPLVSTLNASDGVITSNMAVVPTRNGMIDVFTSNPTHVVLDLFGYFAP